MSPACLQMVEMALCMLTAVPLGNLDQTFTHNPMEQSMKYLMTPALRWGSGRWIRVSWAPT